MSRVWVTSIKNIPDHWRFKEENTSLPREMKMSILGSGSVMFKRKQED